MMLLPIIKINIAALVVLFIAVLMIFEYFENPTKDAWKKFKSKRAEKIAHFLVRIFIASMLILCIFSVNIPVLRDTFSHQKPITLIGRADHVSTGLFTFCTYWFYQCFTTDKVTLYVFFYPKIIIEGKTYRVTYLPYSRVVLTIEEE